MKTLLATLALADASTGVFQAGGNLISAGHIRATANVICDRLAPSDAPIYLYTRSAALFAAGLLAAARLNRTLVCPANLRATYLDEIGPSRSVLLTDYEIDFPNTLNLSLASGDEGPWDACPTDLDILFYTSGTTEAPKPVPKKIALLDAEASQLERLWGAEAGAVITTVSHQHIYGMLFRIFWPIQSGRVSPDVAAEYWMQLSGQVVSGTTLVTSPAHLTRLPASDSLAHVRPGLIFSSGAPLPYAAAQATKTILGRLPLEVLGSTETGGIAWRKQENEDQLWTPFPSVQVFSDQGGRLLVASPLTGQADPVHTGDFADHYGDGFRLKGRADRVVKVEGKRVSLSRVEQVLRGLSLVEDAAAIDLPARKGRLGAIVELSATGEQALTEMGAFRLTRELRQALTSQLESAESPKHWRFETIARNSQGKPLQSEMRAAFQDHAEVSFGRSRLKSFSTDGVTIELELIPAMVWFDGHFPGQPVLSGVAQIHIAAHWSQRLWQWRPSSNNLSQLKFRHILRPGDRVLLSLDREPRKGRLRFAFRLGHTVASEGIIGDMA